MSSHPQAWERPSHAEQRALLIEAAALESVKLTTAGFDLVQAMTGHESVYGCPDKPAVWVGSCNHGAIQCVRKPKVHGVCPDSRLLGESWVHRSCFSSIDTHPKDDGTSTVYAVCFAADPSHLDGVRRVLRLLRRMRVIDAANAGVTLTYSAALRAARYYEGWGATQEQRIANHAQALTRWLPRIHAGLVGFGPEDEYGEAEGLRWRLELEQFSWQHLLDEAQTDMLDERDAAIREPIG